LTPGPALIRGLVDHHGFAEQRFRIESRVVHGRAAHRNDRFNHLMARTVNETSCLDMTAEVACRNLGPKRVDARIECDHGSRIAAAEHRIEGTRGLTFRTFRSPGLSSRRPGKDIEMHPRLRVHETTQE